MRGRQRKAHGSCAARLRFGEGQHPAAPGSGHGDTYPYANLIAHKLPLRFSFTTFRDLADADELRSRSVGRMRRDVGAGRAVNLPHLFMSRIR